MTDPELESHAERLHQTSLEDVPQDFRDVTRDRLKQSSEERTMQRRAKIFPYLEEQNEADPLVVRVVLLSVLRAEVVGHARMGNFSTDLVKKADVVIIAKGKKRGLSLWRSKLQMRGRGSWG